MLGRYQFFPYILWPGLNEKETSLVASSRDIALQLVLGLVITYICV
jgi:hypothetical protein